MCATGAISLNPTRADSSQALSAFISRIMISFRYVTSPLGSLQPASEFSLASTIMHNHETGDKAPNMGGNPILVSLLSAPPK